MPPASGDELPVVDKVLAAQGAPGVWVMGLLRDARRILSSDVLERPAEVAESCLRARGRPPEGARHPSRGGPEVRVRRPASRRTGPRATATGRGISAGR